MQFEFSFCNLKKACPDNLVDTKLRKEFSAKLHHPLIPLQEEHRDRITVTANAPILKAGNLDWSIVLSIYILLRLVQSKHVNSQSHRHIIQVPDSLIGMQNLGALLCLNEGNVHTTAHLFLLPPLSDWLVDWNHYFFCDMESDQTFRAVRDLIDAEVIPSPWLCLDPTKYTVARGEKHCSAL